MFGMILSSNDSTGFKECVVMFLEVGDRVRFVKKVHRVKTTTPLHSVGVLSDKTDESVLNCFVVFNTEEGVKTDWFNEDELELVEKRYENIKHYRLG